ncbi:MAG: TSUP family transporter [Burkholderiales bacterium]
MGNVDFTLLGSLLLGSLPGVYLGSQLGGKIPERALQAGLAAVLATVGGKLVM